jgi:hypothetical protein
MPIFIEEYEAPFSCKASSNKMEQHLSVLLLLLQHLKTGKFFFLTKNSPLTLRFQCSGEWQQMLLVYYKKWQLKD